MKKTTNKPKNNSAKTNKKANASKNTETKTSGENLSRKVSSIDDRESQRIPMQLLVDYRSNGNYLFDFCRDLGAGGIFIETQNPQPQGSQVHLTFTLPDSKETLRAVGNVIWVQEKIPGRKELTPGMGVQFSDFSKSDREKLESFLNRTGRNTQPQKNNPTQRSA